MKDLRRPALFLLILFVTVPLGCGGGDDGGTTPVQPTDLGNVTLSVTSAEPMTRIEVNGLPSAKADSEYEVIFLDQEGSDHFSLPLEVSAEGLPWFDAPFHPFAPNDGGTVSLLISDGDLRSTEQELELGSLPSSPGSFARFVTVLREHIDQRAQLEGSFFDALAATSFDDLDLRLMQLKTAQSFVDDPNHANCLARVADGSSSYLNDEQLELLDSVFGFAPIDSLVQADIDRLSGNKASMFDWYSGGSDKGDCVNVGPTVSTAQELSDAMIKAFEGKIATDPSGAPGQILGALGLGLGAAAFVPGAAPVAGIIGAGVYAYQTSREYHANTYPSSFVSLTFGFDRGQIPEDEPGFARWQDVMVVAKSNGWVADKAIFDGVMQLVGAGIGPTKQLKIQNSTTLRDAALTDVNMGLGTYLDGQPEGVVEFCSQRWGVDITDLPFSRGASMRGFTTIDTQWREIRPAAAGTDMIKVSADFQKFGAQTISTEMPFEVKAIQVIATPDNIFVQTLGEVVYITATIQNADLETLDWRPEAGTWDDFMGNETNGPATRPLKTPASEGDYPFLVVVESTSKQGARESGLPSRRDIVTVRYQKASIVVNPPDACVINGDNETFEATVQGLANTAVTWTLEPVQPGGAVIGNITQGGVFTAPSAGSGSVMVVATSQENPEIVGKTEVEVGACSCYWTLTIEGDGAWTGDYAGHGFAAQFNPFSLSFGYINSAEDGLGNVQIFEENGPTAGVTGSWDCNFSWAIGDRVWVSTNTEGTLSTFVIDTNTEAQVKSLISGIVLTAVNGEDLYRPFTMTIRSGDARSGDACGEN